MSGNPLLQALEFSSLNRGSATKLQMSPHEIFLIQEWRAPFPVIQRALRGIISYILPEENLIALTCQPVYEVLIDEAGNTGT